MPFLKITSLVILPIFIGLCAFLLSRKILHYFQLESYQFRGYFKTLRRQWRPVVRRFGCFAAGVISAYAVTRFNSALLNILCALLFAGTGVFIYRRDRAEKEKKPLHFTARVKRLCGFYIAVLLAAHTASALLSGSVLLCALWALLTPLLLALGALLALPVEKAVYEYYFRSARTKLMRDKSLIRIGITGSWGKTSNKFILETLLKEKYSVLTTPGSFNTPMGLCRVIRERLQPGHQIFIAEMGARHRGDIKELCRLVRPKIGLLTAVGPQHLDTFKTIDRIAQTKYDLIRGLSADGFAVFMDDGGRVRVLYEKTSAPTAFISGSSGDDAWADHITCDAQGSHFDLHFKEDQTVIQCSTQMLGRMNIDNITACALLAKHLGLSNEQIRRGIDRLRPVEHRMQLVNSGDHTVIDDAFNSNPVSSALALDTLALFDARRIVVTPGMVELGRDEEKYNQEFGEKMALCADVALLVGDKHTAPIKRGLEEKGFAEDQIHVFNTLDEAVRYLNGIRQPGDVILYENDLPDNYS